MRKAYLCKIGEKSIKEEVSKSDFIKIKYFDQN